MDIGGNKNAKDFFESQPDYSPNMAPLQKYSSRFATLYREKLSAEAEGKTWTPSAASSPVAAAPKRAATAATRSLGSQRSNNSSGRSSPAFGNNNYNGSSNGFGSNEPAGLVSGKEKNEQYFATLGQANNTRDATLPPNQGGKFTGFGNPAFENQSSSRNTTPGIDDIINDPMQALTKGWSLLSTGMEELGKVAAEGVKVAAQSAGQLSRYTNDNYIKPAQTQWNDPNFRNNVTGYVQTFGEKTRSLVNDSFNQGNRNNSSGSLRSSYSSSSHTNNDNNDDFFNSTISSLQQQTPTSRSASPSSQAPSRTRTPLRESSTVKKTSSAAKKDSDDEWEGW
ncbi:unnamed protein product [Mucor hiemalis]